MTTVVEAVDLRRTYKTTTGTFRRGSVEVEAVRGISFEIQEGELFGLLGPNGAGKTTTIKMLITLLIPTSGTARVLGHDVVKDAKWVRQRIGYVFGGDRGLYERLSALDNLRYFAELYGVDPKVQRTRIHELLELVGLNGREKERVEGYSRGMRQRLHIARGILHDPPVVFLDEPSIGVDPVGRPRAALDDRRPPRRRQDRAADDALHVRGGRALRPHRRRRARRDRRPGNAARPQGRASATARSSRSRSTGSGTTRSPRCGRSTG